jgi:voltage-gated potassium channel
VTRPADGPGWRRRAALALDPELRVAPGLSPVNKAVAWLILASILLGILETEATIRIDREAFFATADLVVTLAFAVEYVLRVWASAENPRYRSRWAYARSPAAILDLVAILVIAASYVDAEGFLLRLARLIRLLRLARLGRFSHAWETVIHAIGRRRHELCISLMVTALLLVITSSLLYLVEGSLQPEAFGSIPRAMWWSVATLTTVGYGDVVPVTPLGRIFGAISAVIGIGLIAMPAGILAAAFSDVMRARDPEDTGPRD